MQGGMALEPRAPHICSMAWFSARTSPQFAHTAGATGGDEVAAWGDSQPEAGVGLLHDEGVFGALGHGVDEGTRDGVDLRIRGARRIGQHEGDLPLRVRRHSRSANSFGSSFITCRKRRRTSSVLRWAKPRCSAASVAGMDRSQHQFAAVGQHDAFAFGRWRLVGGAIAQALGRA